MMINPLQTAANQSIDQAMQNIVRPWIWLTQTDENTYQHEYSQFVHPSTITNQRQQLYPRKSLFWLM
jgi:hypothetical protein